MNAYDVAAIDTDGNRNDFVVWDESQERAERAAAVEADSKWLTVQTVTAR